MRFVLHKIGGMSLWQPFQLSQLWPLLKEAAADWSHDKAPRLGAALAYYTVFSIVPLLVLFIAIIGLVFGQEAAQTTIIDQISTLVGERGAATIKEMIQKADEPATGIVSSSIAVITLLLGAAGFFGQLKDALDTVWGIEPKEGRGILGYLKDNLLSVVTVFGTGFLLLVSLIISAALAVVGKWFDNLLPLPEVALQGLNVLLSFLIITGLFALIFKVLPDAHIAWPDVWMGAAITSALFTVGKFAIGLYLCKSNVGTGFGAAGSLVIVLVWVYYSAQILLYGAEFTQVYANRMGQRIQPSAEANVVNFKKAEPQNRTMRTERSAMERGVSDSHEATSMRTKRTEVSLTKSRPSSKIYSFIESHPLLALGSFLLVNYLVYEYSKDNTEGKESGEQNKRRLF
jgi:membrane protein